MYDDCVTSNSLVSAIASIVHVTAKIIRICPGVIHLLLTVVPSLLGWYSLALSSI